MIKKIISLTIGLLLLFTLCAGWFFYSHYWPIHASESTVPLTIVYGMGPTEIADSLQSKGIIKSSKSFKRLLKIYRNAGNLKAGFYNFPLGCSSYIAMKKLVLGEQSFIKVTLPEGYRSEKFASILSDKMKVDSTLLMNLVKDSSFAASQGIGSGSLDGYLLPETYYFTFGLSEHQILKNIVDEFKKTFSDSLRQTFGNDFHRMIILASIIEGEAMIDSEMVIISSVYHNRLERGMPLQADPTIQYLISDGPRRLLYRDLEIDSPYNTYKYTGLPPGPINNPGKKAIWAALDPNDTPYLYFVADGTGGHRFSETLDQHLNSKKILDRLRKQLARDKQ